MWGDGGAECEDEEVPGRAEVDGRGAEGARVLGKMGTGELDCCSLTMPIGGWSWFWVYPT